jgi:uncharacterized membrane protein YphA (DoxX/SURF4 family)
MKPKTIKITYWILLIIFCLALTADGIGGISKAKEGVDALNRLGYPPYILPLLGVLKILGVVALLQTRYQRIKEWVFAGVTFNFIGAAVSHVASKHPLSEAMQPIIALVVMLIVYIFWKKYEQVKNIS